MGIVYCFAAFGAFCAVALVVCLVMFIRQVTRDGWGA